MGVSSVSFATSSTIPRPRRVFAVRDMSRIFADEEREVFTDIVHYTLEGRERVAKALAAEVDEAIRATRGSDGVMQPN